MQGKRGCDGLPEGDSVGRREGEEGRWQNSPLGGLERRREGLGSGEQKGPRATVVMYSAVPVSKVLLFERWRRRKRFNLRCHFSRVTKYSRKSLFVLMSEGTVFSPYRPSLFVRRP